jgi:HAD superfamily hydrolase (TIGR01509 family)
MIKNIVFDLDGVIFDGVKFHKDMFMNAVFNIKPDININEEFHALYLNGLSTRQKLGVLYERGLITKEESDKINMIKIQYTSDGLNKIIIKNKSIKGIILKLKKMNYKLFCVSNSIRDTCNIILKKMDIYDQFNDIISNEDVKTPKPSPEPYLHLFNKLGLIPGECVILEDSHHGREAAYTSGAYVIPIVDTKDVTLKKILTEIQKIDMCDPYREQHVNIVVPMAGHGSRFSKAGYSVPKPFIKVFGKPMIQWVIENIKPSDETYGKTEVKTHIIPHFHFIAQTEHLKHYDLGKICKTVGVDYTITTVDKVTEGPACTVLLTKQYINNDLPLIIINSDQYVDWDVNNFYRCVLNPDIDGCINTFYQPNEKDIKWSYTKLDDDGFVSEVAEKKYISSLATSGIYGWGRGKDFVRCAEEMITKGERVNNEFYVCPVYNYLIRGGGRVRTFDCKKLWGLGVPEDLEHFLQCYKGND